MTRKAMIFLIGVALIVLFVGAGCSWLRRTPERSPAPQEESSQIEIPAPINRGENREPVLRVYFSESNSIRPLNIEDYIQGVVAAEMEPSWPKEVLAAQSIIARSFTLQKIAENGGVPGRNAHASTNIEEFQAYDASRINDNVRAAVESTRGMVAVYGNEFIRGWFHAYAGPRTATATEGLDFAGPNPPYITVVDSPAREVIPKEERDWQARFSLAAIREAVRKITGQDPGAITGISIARKGPSGRATRLQVNNVEVSAPQLRIALGSTEMRSTYLEDIKIEGASVVMNGTGYGHGVGMCQWGAHAYALRGWSFQQILAHYYPGATLERVLSQNLGQ